MPSRVRFWRCAAWIVVAMGLAGTHASAQQFWGSDQAGGPDQAGSAPQTPPPADGLRDMDTDRPNKTDTPHTINAGHVQIEIGAIDLARQDSSVHGVAFDTLTLMPGATDIRVGVSDRFELNAVVTPYEVQIVRREGGSAVRMAGFGDLVVGGKLNLLGDDADGVWAVGLAIKPQFKLPTAGAGLGNGHGEAMIELPLLINLPADFHLGLQTVGSAERNSENSAYVGGWQNSVSLDRALIGQADVYVEYWTKATSGRGQETQETFDIGVTYPATRNVVIDTGFNFGLTRATAGFEWLAGVSLRL